MNLYTLLYFLLVSSFDRVSIQKPVSFSLSTYKMVQFFCVIRTVSL